ncbi:hypothetical protein MNEG_16816 (mitochondrion) [Monoraphidium neglectum]|jgi:hypothetical protein|uniref:Uncharacterized protein n=1 Tax=Monoraphidium neglectum TaxID=145388 RepID=A0A0D2LNU8_9CHLO|nr:hypothetical protein MNEG_16816 [Monoraphidium neglectum]KIZ07959.1 hypothetical protein MNEG_16816 [Monoraphidium neglectum]|eukprot:XP_013906978.1 hypothetical protein MNEG_16816 (mitochondrion) [Monoraphidium neglectum]
MTASVRSFRVSLWAQPLLSVVQTHLITYPTPSNLSGNWNWGVLAGLCLVLVRRCAAIHAVGEITICTIFAKEKKITKK